MVKFQNGQTRNVNFLELNVFGFYHFELWHFGSDRFAILTFIKKLSPKKFLSLFQVPQYVNQYPTKFICPKYECYSPEDATITVREKPRSWQKNFFLDVQRFRSNESCSCSPAATTTKFTTNWRTNSRKLIGSPLVFWRAKSCFAATLKGVNSLEVTSLSIKGS